MCVGFVLQEEAEAQRKRAEAAEKAEREAAEERARAAAAAKAEAEEVAKRLAEAKVRSVVCVCMLYVSAVLTIVFAGES